MMISGFAGAFGKMGALQHVLGHGDRLPQIFFAAAALEDVGQEGDDIVGRQRGEIRLAHSAASCRGISIAASVDSNPSLSA